MRINQNIAAMSALRNLSTNSTHMQKSLDRLSSGFRISRAADDSAGLVISEGLRSQMGGLKVASRNAQDGISIVQTAEGALTEVHSILQRMRDLSVQANNTGTNGTAAVTAIQDEIDQLALELDRISATTEFNGTQLLDGSYEGTFQVGAGASADHQIGVSINEMSASGLSVDALDMTDATAAITALDTAIETVSAARGELGAVQNRFEHTIANLGVAIENISASESRIRDTDMADEMAKFTRHQIMVQAGTAMLAQANTSTQSVLALLRG